MSIEQGIGAPRELDGGLTGVELANQFITVNTAGVRDLVKRFQDLTNAATAPATLRRIVRKASDPIFNDYKDRAQTFEATGNLAASVTRKYVDYPEGVVCVVGPRQTGPVGDSPERRSGNHAWLVEFGTGPRKPGSRGRRTYVNVHQKINGKMTKAGGFNNTEFENMGRGYYFLMGSKFEPSRQGQGRAGYSRDFSDSYGTREQHPITLKPGDTLRPMPALKLMEKTIRSRGPEVLGILTSLLEKEIAVRGG